MVLRLPTSLLQKPGGGFALAALVPMVGTPNKDASENREGDGSLALGGSHLVVRRNNQPIVGGSNRMYDGEDARLGWSVWGEGVFLISGWQIERQI
jgi:hypothetical protein